MRAVDTNVLLRAVVPEPGREHAVASAFLEGEPVYVPITVFLEMEWVLRSRYGLDAASVRRRALGHRVHGQRGGGRTQGIGAGDIAFAARLGLCRRVASCAFGRLRRLCVV
jgi:hypothetical protein